METLGKRIKRIINYNGSTMTQFAKELNISQSMVSKICSDKAVPSDRTISDICRIYNINKEWLLQGIGEMADKQSLEDELADSFNTHGSSSLSNELKRATISLLVKTPPAAWPIIAEYFQNVAAKCNENPDRIDAYMEGYQEGVRAAQKIKEITDSFSDEPKE